MRLQQTIVLWLGILAFVFLTLRPPWVETYSRPFSDSGIVLREVPLGARWVWKAKPSGAFGNIRVDFQRLALEWVVVATTTGALFWTFKRASRYGGSVNHHDR